MFFFCITVNFIIQKLKSKHLVCLSFLWWQAFFWGNERKCFPHIPGQSLLPFPYNQLVPRSLLQRKQSKMWYPKWTIKKVFNGETENWNIKWNLADIHTVTWFRTPERDERLFDEKKRSRVRYIALRKVCRAVSLQTQWELIAHNYTCFWALCCFLLSPLFLIAQNL